MLVDAIRCLTGLNTYEYLIDMIFPRNIHETVAVVAVAAVVLIALQPLVKRVGCMIACLALTKTCVVCVVFHLGTALVCLNDLRKDNRFFPPSKGPTCSQKTGFLGDAENFGSFPN